MKKKLNLPDAPISIKLVNRLLIVAIVALALLAGYFHAKLDTEKRKYDVLEKAGLPE